MRHSNNQGQSGEKMSNIAHGIEDAGPTIGQDSGSANTESRQVDIMPHPSRGGDVMSRDYFLTQIHREKRRADRSQAPLSLVVMRLAERCEFDKDDHRDIVTDLSLSMRESDVIGCLGDGVVAFLLPYSEAKAADAFSKLIVNRTQIPATDVQFATYPETGFETLLIDALSEIESNQISAPSAARKDSSLLWMKRVIDIVGSIALIVISSPLMFATALAVKLTSRGPIIFRQMRIGRGGVPFPFYKFRSMTCGSDDAIHREYVKKLIVGNHDQINGGDADNPVYKLQADSRITTVGRFIRRTSIDELPQLFNVLKGEMSLVGPRPPIPYEIEDYKSWHMRRLAGGSTGNYWLVAS